MALFIGKSLAQSGILSLAEAEAAFHPWWEALQDYTCFTAILIGLFAIPQSNQELTCSIVHPNKFESPASASYVNGYCTREHLPIFVRFLPYVMVLGPSILVALEKFAQRLSIASAKMNRFYMLVVRDTIHTDDLDGLLSKSRADLKAIRNEFRDSNALVINFVVTAVAKFLLSGLYLAWIISSGHDTFFIVDGEGSHFKNYQGCRLAEVEFTCIIPQTQFFSYILIIVGFLVTAYMLSALYAIVWLMIKRLRKLSSLLNHYRRGVRKYSRKMNWKASVFQQKMDVYGGLESPDVELLLDLLSETRGVQSALRILTMIDEEFIYSWKVKEVRQQEGTFAEGPGSTSVAFQDAPIAKYLESKGGKLMYLANIEDENGENIQRYAQLFTRAKIEQAKNKVDPEEPKTDSIFIANFPNLRQGVLHKVVISTIYDGKEVSETHFQVYTKPRAPCKVRVLKWDFSMLNGDLGFELKVVWDHVKVSNGDFNRGYAVDLLQNETSLLPDETTTSSNTFKYMAVDNGDPDVNSKFSIRLWTIDMDNPSVRSVEPYEKDIPPIPSKMKNYADFLKRRTFAENPRAYSNDGRKNGSQDRGSYDYSFNMAILNQVTRDLRDLARGVQSANIEYANFTIDEESEEEIVGGCQDIIPD